MLLKIQDLSLCKTKYKLVLKKYLAKTVKNILFTTGWTHSALAKK